MKTLKQIQRAVLIAGICCTTQLFSQGSSVSFNGVDNYITTPDASDINLVAQGSRTIQTWFLADDITSGKQLIYDEGDANNGYVIYLDSGSIYAGAWSETGSWDSGTYISSTDIVSNRWHHISVVLDGGTATLTADKFLVYLDGILLGTGDGAEMKSHSEIISWGDISGRTQFHDGDSNTNDHAYFAGKLDEFKLWDSARTSDEVRQDMNTQPGGVVSNLIVYYNFDGTGTTITDQSLSHDGTLNGTETRTTSGVYTVWQTGNGSANWSSSANWSNGIPGIGVAGLAQIPSGGTQPIIAGKVNANSIQLKNGAELHIDPNSALIIDGSVEISGVEAMVLESDSEGTGNFIDGGGVSYSNGGSVKIQRYWDAGSGVYQEGYHYISTPVDNHEKFVDMTDLYAYRETDMTWLHHGDITDGFSKFDNAEGYAIRYTSPVTKEFIGDLNTGDVEVAVTHTTNGGSSFEYYDLIGNPYASSVNVIEVVAANPTVLEPTVHFWNGTDYSTYNTSLEAGTKGSSSTSPDGNIAVGQGFYVETKASGNVKFTSSVRGTESDIYYRKSSYPFFRLGINAEGEQADIMISGHPSSLQGKDDYDSRYMPGLGSLQFSSRLEKQNMAIQSVPNLLGQTFDLDVLKNGGGEITFAIDEYEMMDGLDVWLEDRSTGKLINISEETYSCTVEDLESPDRFVVRVLAKQSQMEEAEAYFSGNGIHIIPEEGIKYERFELTDINGRVVAQWIGLHYNKLENLSSGVYLLQLHHSAGVYVKKMQLL